MIDLERASAQFRERISAALVGDPACGGRVCTGTIDWITEEAVRMARAVERKLGNGRLTDSSAKPSVLSEAPAGDAGGSVAAGNGKDASGGGCDG